LADAAAAGAGEASGRKEVSDEAPPYRRSYGCTELEAEVKSYQGCIPCMARQAERSVRTAVQDPSVQAEAMRELQRAIDDIDMRESPPVMGQRIHRIVREVTGNQDPYREVKDRFNQLALERYTELTETVRRSASPVEAAVRLAIAGNVIDSGANGELDETHVRSAVRSAFSEPLDGRAEDFAQAVSAAQRILYLADNAGEIVFDRLLIELLPLERVTVAVRGAPVLNDATIADARTAGLLGVVQVVDNGSDAPGTILEDCTESFRERFDEADLVIAKGQGNYETLSEVEHNVFFLLKVKCPVIARDIKCDVGAMVLKGGEHNASGRWNGAGRDGSDDR